MFYLCETFHDVRPKTRQSLVVSGCGLGDLLQIHFQHISTRFGFSRSVCGWDTCRFEPNKSVSDRRQCVRVETCHAVQHLMR
ncbi:hypothetical protein XF_1240 [Xylella fastidiosa 9a5c]|uniref:Uncharacterized protein n=1 Tax=Xylella fastidiosa (strain 9a5c) TaxID=160492 RepID=Q9PDY8_XYLFA|nr:hypothetical protein XF_1240 [Xylella fastidiosa 9a5c]